MGGILEFMPYFYYYIAAIAVLLLVFFGFRNSPDETKTKVLYFLCVVNFIAYISNVYYFYLRGDSILTLLPIQLCEISVFLIPLALLLKKQVLYDFIFYVCALGAFIALAVPSSDYIGEAGTFMAVSFIAFHSIVVGIPFLLAGWGLYSPVPTVKSVVRLSAAVFILALFSHAVNLAFGKWFGVKADYFFTIIRYSAPSNPVFELFSRLIPVDLLYLLPGLPILWVYVPIVSLPWSMKKRPVRTDGGSFKL